MTQSDNLAILPACLCVRCEQMTVLVKILQYAIAQNEKVAVFSQSLATLDIIEVNLWCWWMYGQAVCYA